MASARSSSFRSQPGYVTRPVISSAYPAPSMSIPAIPTVPGIDDARAPNAIGRGWIQTQLSNLPGKYNPALGLARDNARAQLAGYGGVTFRDDDPNTPEREDLQVSFDPNAKLGQREKNTVDNERNQANAAGMMESSFNDKNIGAALTRLNEEKRAIVNNFAGQINSVLTQQAGETTSLITDWTRLYGEDSRWLIDNPPPTPPRTMDQVAQEDYGQPRAGVILEGGNEALKPSNVTLQSPTSGGLPPVVRNPGPGSIDGLRRRGYRQRPGTNIWVKA